ncbi:MAG: ribonuclease P protein component [Gammaproteobacteria bacterium]|nr:ribonuclease P protein component [Gammaproteobacteria bacterium]
MKKNQRIKKSEEIESIIKERRVVSGENFVLYTKENHQNKKPRFALSVPKKFGIAVKRNQIKRRMRSIFDNANIKKEFDVFVVAKKNSSLLEFDEIEKELIMLFNKADLLEEK